MFKSIGKNIFKLINESDAPRYLPDGAINKTVPEDVIAAADRLVKGTPYGYVKSTDGIKIPIWGAYREKESRSSQNPTSIVLQKFHDGSGVFVRYYSRDVIIDDAYKNSPEYLQYCKLRK